MQKVLNVFWVLAGIFVLIVIFSAGQNSSSKGFSMYDDYLEREPQENPEVEELRGQLEDAQSCISGYKDHVSELEDYANSGLVESDYEQKDYYLQQIADEATNEPSDCY